jgi:hypothetical protein
MPQVSEIESPFRGCVSSWRPSKPSPAGHTSPPASSNRSEEIVP